MKSFSYSSFLPSFIVSIRCLISSQSFVNFANTFLLPSVEVKTKYLFPLFSAIYPSALPIIRYYGFTLLIFSKSPIFLLWYNQYYRCQYFCRTFCLFLSSLNQIFHFNHIIKKVICTIFNINLLNFSHLYVQQSCIQ